ncbi:MAG: hypothetical protein Q9222_003726 [Ikaeria aurantiellina]
MPLLRRSISITEGIPPLNNLRGCFRKYYPSRRAYKCRIPFRLDIWEIPGRDATLLSPPVSPKTVAFQDEEMDPVGDTGSDTRWSLESSERDGSDTFIDIDGSECVELSPEDCWTKVKKFGLNDDGGSVVSEEGDLGLYLETTLRKRRKEIGAERGVENDDGGYGSDVHAGIDAREGRRALENAISNSRGDRQPNAAASDPRAKFRARVPKPKTYGVYEKFEGPRQEVRFRRRECILAIDMLIC